LQSGAAAAVAVGSTSWGNGEKHGRKKTVTGGSGNPGKQDKSTLGKWSKKKSSSLGTRIKSNRVRWGGAQTNFSQEERGKRLHNLQGLREGLNKHLKKKQKKSGAGLLTRKKKKNAVGKKRCAVSKGRGLKKVEEVEITGKRKKKSLGRSFPVSRYRLNVKKLSGMKLRPKKKLKKKRGEGGLNCRTKPSPPRQRPIVRGCNKKERNVEKRRQKEKDCGRALSGNKSDPVLLEEFNRVISPCFQEVKRNRLGRK